MLIAAQVRVTTQFAGAIAGLLIAAAVGILASAAQERRTGPAAQEAVSAVKSTTVKAKSGSPRRPRFTEHQIPAGTTLPIELRTRLSSNGNRRSDALEGRLLRALTSSDGVELVPEGASVLGTVSEAAPAGVRQPGRLAFTFQIVEHPETGSRATITAAVLTYESQPPVKGKVFTDVRLEKGVDASVLLLAPLLVRIPVSH
jgi:hypothetical protein